MNNLGEVYIQQQQKKTKQKPSDLWSTLYSSVHCTHVFGFCVCLPQDSNDFANIQLTPEQQRQLEMIDNMPLIKERYIPDANMMGDPNDPDLGKDENLFFPDQ